MLQSVLYYLSLVMCFGISLEQPPNNVCTNLGDYATKLTNPKCRYNPDADLGMTQIGKRYGYPIEKHRILTEDGYRSTLFRVGKNHKGPPILLQHGLAFNSLTWILMGKKSPAFILTDHGFDVWMSNARGSKFSREHTKLTPNKPQFWNFSFHEMGIYDLPVVIDYIVKQTGQKGNLTYIGLSMGTTMSYVYASTKPEHAKENLKMIISLAPIAYLGNIRSLAKELAQMKSTIKTFLHSIGMYGIGQFEQMQKDLIGVTCSNYPTILFCLNLMHSFAGLSIKEIDVEAIPILFNHFPSGTSVKTFEHFSQIIEVKDRFQYFDYGNEINEKLYNRSTPPEYNLERINVPLHLFYGLDDFLSDATDVKRLYDRLKTKKSMNLIKINGTIDICHNTYILGKDTEYIYRLIIDLIEKSS